MVLTHQLKTIKAKPGVCVCARAALCDAIGSCAAPLSVTLEKCKAKLGAVSSRPAMEH